jgi:hypothetical protein
LFAALGIGAAPIRMAMARRAFPVVSQPELGKQNLLLTVIYSFFSEARVNCR